jgi:probable phosphoglycerate mutase
MTDALPGTRGRRRIYLMRHGEVSYHRPDGSTVFGDVELTDVGVAQAQAAGALLADVPFDVAVHTGLARTRRTAALVLAGRDVPMREIEALSELKGGSFDGLTEARIEAEFVYGMERAALPGAGFPGGETFADCQARVVPAFEALVLQGGWSTALVVAHGGTNALLLSWFTRGGLAGASCFEQDAGCVNILDVDVIDGEVIRRLVRAINLTPYDWMKREHLLTVTERIVGSRRRAASPPDGAR